MLLYNNFLKCNLGALIIILFGVLTGFATNFATLVAFRVIVGFGLGGATIPFDLLAEFLPQSSRGQFLMNINYFWCEYLCTGNIYSSFYLGCLI